MSIVQHSTSVPTETSYVLAALSTVYSTATATPQHATLPQASSPQLQQYDVSTRAGADHFLVDFQRSPTAWQVVDAMLANPSAQSTHSFFASQTLHSKIRDDMYQVPPTAFSSLRNSILAHLERHSSNPAAESKPVVTRLCLALSALAVQMQWDAIIPDLLSNDPTKQGGTLPPQLKLELFKLIPEEANSPRLYLQSEQDRFVFNQNLSQNAAAILDFIHQTATATLQMPPVQEMCLSCLQMWIKHVPVPSSLWTSHPILFNHVFSIGMESPQYFEASTDVIVEVLRSYESDHPSNAGLVQKMVPAIMNLKPRFQAALSGGDEDTVRAYCRIFTEMGESYMSLLMDQQDLNQALLVQVVLECAAVPDQDSACITMNFWYRFINCLENIHDLRFRQMKVDYFQPMLVELIDVCCALMQFPEEINDGLEENEMDELKKNRAFVADTIEDCCRLLGPDVILVQIGTRIQKVVTAQSTLPPPQQRALWQPLESCLFAVKSISKFIPRDEEKMMPHVMNLIQQYSTDTALHHSFRITTNSLIGGYAGWLKTHPTYLEPFFAFVLFGFNSPLTSESSALAIKHLCESCDAQMGNPVLNLYEQVVSSATVDLRDELYVLEGLCHIMSKQDYDVAAGTLGRVMQPIGAHLESVLANPAADSKLVVGQLDRLSVLVSKLKSNGPKLSTQSSLVVSLVTQCWPFFEQIVQRYGSEGRCAEKLCRVYKQALRAVKHEFEPLLNSLLQQLVAVFEHCFKSNYLYCASICITEFGDRADWAERLFAAITALSRSAFKRFTSIEGFTNNPDVVEEYFYLLSRVISYSPAPLLLSELVGEAVSCAIVGMQVHHREANKGVLNFLENVIGYGLRANVSEAERNQIGRAISANGENLCFGICQSLMGDSPLFFLDSGNGSLAGVLFKLTQLCGGAAVNSWVERGAVKAMAGNPALNEICAQLASGVGTLSNRNEFNAMIRGFHDGCWRVRRQNQSQ